MKKVKFLCFLLLLVLPFRVKAYGIENYYIDATIESNGDILVQEYFNLTGEFNGFERIIKYANDELYEFDSSMTAFGGSLIHNGDGLEIIEVKAVPVDSNFNFLDIAGDVFTQKISASKGDYGVYTVEEVDYGKSILIYNPSSYNKSFYIKYRIKNIAIKHNDVAEIAWNIVGSELSETVANFKAYLHIPGNSNVKAWAHGPINGNVSIIDPETVLVTIENLSSYRAIDVRTTFDLNVISQSTKYTNTNALDKIILYETDKAEQANYERLNQDKKRQQLALEYLNKFEVYMTRFYYDYALEYILDITDVSIKTEYFNKLMELKKILDKNEEEIAQSALELALNNPKYSCYEDAKERIMILDNIDIRNELLDELLIVENIIKNNELKLEKRNYIFGGVLLLIALILGYYIYKIYRKDPIVDFNEKYFRDIPNDYTPETVSYLFYKKITNNALSASIMDLLRKKIITAEKIKRSNYKLILNQEYDCELTTTEKKLIELIFHGKTKIETKDIKKYAKKHYNSYIQAWNSYHTCSLNIAKRNLFYKSDGKLKKNKEEKFDKSFIVIFIMMFLMFFFPILLFILFLYLIGLLIYQLYKYFSEYFKDDSNDHMKMVFTISNVILIFTSIYKLISIPILQNFYRDSRIVYLIIILFSIVSLIVLYNKNQRTEQGALEYKKWKALKNFLNDFGKFSDKEVNEITLWEKYLVYATLFGCSKKVLKAMKIEFVDAPNDYFDTYRDLLVVNHCMTHSVRASYKSARSAYSVANSSSGSSGGGFSSGGGGGGGFSSGGGSFGGGGGGGRF